MASSDSFWLSIWERVADIGMAVVIVGIAIEVVELLLKWVEKKKYRKVRKGLAPDTRCVVAFIVKHSRHAKLEIEAVGFVLVVLGLLAEFVGERESKKILDSNNASLISKAAVLQQRVEELRKQNDDFEAGRYSRGSHMNWDLFVKALKEKPKHKAEILYKPDDSESFDFARDFELFLNQAGWDVIALRPFSENDVSKDKLLRFPDDRPPYEFPLSYRIGVGTGGILFVSNNKTAMGDFFVSMDKSTLPRGEIMCALWQSMKNDGKNDSGMHFGSGWDDDERVPDDEIKIIIGQK